MRPACACGSIRDTLMGVAGGQVWQGGWDEANIPTPAACGCPALRVKVAQRPDQAGSLSVPSSSGPSCQGFCGMGEAGTGNRAPPKLAWILRVLTMKPPYMGARDPRMTSS